MNYFMENRIYPDHIVIRLSEEGIGTKRQPEQFILESCIGTGANCVAYDALRENGVPIRLKQFRPVGVDRRSNLYRMAEERFLEAYRQQISMLRDERTSAVTAGLYGLYRDDSGYCWTSVSSMVGRTLDRILPENSFPTNLHIIRRIAESVKAYHEAGWLLLDIKPENILVIDSPGLHGVNFFDFDSFIRMSELEQAVREGRPVLLSSSESYSAPELTEAEVDLGEIGITADFYSIGALVYHAVFGRRPELFDCLPDCEYDYLTAEEPDVFTADIRKAATRFLNHTLTMSAFGRYGTDDELLSALDEIITLSNTMAPRLSRSIPGTVGDFAGRGRELEKLAEMLRSDCSTVFLSGMGGIGKTQLALKAAQELRDEFDFYYAPFKGTVRETVLALPVENLCTEEYDENGTALRAADDVVYARILSCLREGYNEKSVLIVDNFDAARDEDTPQLIYDPDFPDLESLRMQVVFTSRCRFENRSTVEVGSLEERDLIGMLSEALPEETEETLIRLADDVGRHTLTLSIIAGTVRESKGKLSVQKLLSDLESDDGEDHIRQALRSVFRASGLSRTASSVMACAGLFPQRGISSDLLVRLFTPEQWVTASQLERSGWLRFDRYSGVWTVHPMVRAVCEREKTTRPEWKTVGSFVTALKQLRDSPDTEAFSAEGNMQLNELYANVFRLDLHRPFPWKAVTAACAVLAAILSVVLLRSPTDTSPVFTIELTPQEEATEEDITHDTELILSRFHTAGIRNVETDSRSGVIRASAHTSVLGEIPNLTDTVRLLFNRPAALSAVSNTRPGFYLRETIGREHILSTESAYGVPKGVGRELRQEAGLDVTGEFPYLIICFDEETAAMLNSCYEEYGNLSFAFDEQMGTMGTGFVKLRGVIPGEKENSFYAFDGRWTGERVYRTLAYNLQHEPLHSSYWFSAELDPVADWEDPAAVTEDRPGQNQCSIDDVPADSVICFYSELDPEEVSDYSYQEILASMKRRLDLLEMPYAIGTDYFEDRRIAVCVPTERIGYDILRVLPEHSVRMKPFYTHSNLTLGSSYYYTAEIITTETGNYALKLHTDDDYEMKNLKECTEKMLAENDRTVNLFCGSEIPIASAELENAAEDGTLIFSKLPFIDCSEIGEDHVWILRLLQEVINGGRMTSASVYYTLDEDDIRFRTEDGEFGVKKSLANCNAVIDSINSGFPGAHAWIKESANSQWIDISMHFDLQPGIAGTVADALEEVYLTCDFEKSGADNFLFYLTEEGSNERFRLSFSRIGSDSMGIVPRYYAELVVMGEREAELLPEIEKEFLSREFFTERRFSIRNLNRN